MVRRSALLLIFAIVGCPRPGEIRRTREPIGAAVTIKATRIAVNWLRSDLDRRYPMGRSESLAGDRGILCGWDRDRILHFYSDSDAACEVAFLSPEGKILETQPLPAWSQVGVTSKVEARYALFLPDGWLAGHGAGVGEDVAFSPEIARAPAEPMPQIKVGGATVHVELSYLLAQRIRGLMYRRTMSANDGMLFIYPRAEPHSYWMGNCYYGLDIAYFGADRKLLNAVSIDPYPDPEVDSGLRAPSDGAAQFVLEVHKGWFQARGLADASGKPIGQVVLEMPAAVGKLTEQAE